MVCIKTSSWQALLPLLPHSAAAVVHIAARSLDRAGPSHCSIRSLCVHARQYARAPARSRSLDLGEGTCCQHRVRAAGAHAAQ